MLTSSASRDYNQWHKAQQPGVAVRKDVRIGFLLSAVAKADSYGLSGFCGSTTVDPFATLWQSGKWTVAHNLDSVAAQLRSLCRSQTQIYRVQHMGGFPINAILRMWHMLGQVLQLLPLPRHLVCLPRCCSLAVSAMHGNELAKSVW